MFYLTERKYKEALKETKLSIKSHPGYSETNQPNFDNVQNKNLLLLSFQTQANILREIYSNTEQENDAEESLRYYNLSDQLINELSETEVYEDRLFTLDTLDQVYDNAIELQYDLYKKTGEKSHIASAFYYADKGRNTILKQQLNQSDQKKHGSIPVQMLSMEQALKEDIAYLKSTIYLMIQDDTKNLIDSVKLDYYNDKLFANNRSLDSLKYQFKKQFPAYFNSQYDQTKINLQDIQKSMSDNDQIIQFLSTDDFIYIFSITVQNYNLIRTVKTGNFSEQFRLYLSLINNPSSNAQELSELGKQLFSLLLEPIGELRKHITIIPDGELNLLPFETLPTAHYKQNAKDKFLIQKHSINYASSISHMFRNPDKRRPRKIELMAIASSYSSRDGVIEKDAMRAGLGPLKYTIEEASELIDLYGGNLYLEEMATETNFKAHAKGHRIIHIASHGIVDHKQPLFSRLILEKDPSDTLNDGNLFVHELYNMSLDADMVVLSACNTASGAVAKGEGLLNIGRGFFYAGVPSVVMRSLAGG